MLQKMSLINYYYTEISMLHEEGGAFYRPLFFDFPLDNDATLNITQNVMLGPGLKLSHQSNQDGNYTTSHYYFPEGIWCSVFNKTV